MEKETKESMEPSMKWMNIPEIYRDKITNHVWCGKCLNVATMHKFTCDKYEDGLVLNGICNTCGGPVERVV